MNKEPNIKQNQTYKYREQSDGCQRIDEWGMGDMGEGKWDIQASHYGMNTSQD